MRGAGGGYRNGGGGGYGRNPAPLMYGNYNMGYGYYDDYGDDYYEEDYEEEYYDRCEFGVKVRGLPYKVTESEIRKFFTPLNVISINILYGNDGRPSGEAEVGFETSADADSAMAYDKKYIGSRYVELFMLPPLPSSNGRGGQNNKAGANSSLGSLMTKELSGRVSSSYGDDAFGAFNAAASSVRSSLAQPQNFISAATGNGSNGQDAAGGADSGSAAYPAGMNEMFMAEMAQKIFATAFNRFTQSTASGGAQQQPIQPPPPPPASITSNSGAVRTGFPRRY